MRQCVVHCHSTCSTVPVRFVSVYCYLCFTMRQTRYVAGTRHCCSAGLSYQCCIQQHDSTLRTEYWQCAQTAHWDLYKGAHAGTNFVIISTNSPIAVLVFLNCRIHFSSVDIRLCDVRTVGSTSVAETRVLASDAVCGWITVCRCFKRTYCLRLLWFKVPRRTLKMKAPRLFETSGSHNLATLRHIPQDVRSHVLSYSTRMSIPVFIDYFM